MLPKVSLPNGSPPKVTWAQRAAERSPTVQRSRVRSMRQAEQIIEAARRLIDAGEQWTTQDLAKEAGVAIQTFYRYFGGKDQLLLAVIEDLMSESTQAYARAGQRFDDPVTRLHHYVKMVFSTLRGRDLAGARFIIGQHWRLHQLFPAELALAIQPFTDILADEIRRAQAAGTLPDNDPDRIASFVTRLVMVEYHFYAFAQLDADIDEIAERIWGFCRYGLGHTAAPSTSMGPKPGSLVP
jgi:TetR/AcrR family transcriptional regulator